MSDSDNEEFFDAQDVTPVAINKKTTSSLFTPQNRRLVTSDSALTAEADAISHDSHQNEPSASQAPTVLCTTSRVLLRHNPDDETQQKLDALELRQQEEKDKQQQDVARKAFENGQRRRKLEGMRQFMCDDVTPTRQPVQHTQHSVQNSERFSEHPSAAAMVTNLELTEDQQLEQKLNALSFELEQSGQCLAEGPSDCPSGESLVHGGDLSGNSSHYTTVGSPDSSHYTTVGSFDSLKEGRDGVAPGLFASDARKSSVCSLNSNIGKLKDHGPQSNHDRQPGVVAMDTQPKSSSLPVDLSTYPSSNPVRTVIYDEPDIIQSTKSLPRQQAVTPTSRLDEMSVLPNDLYRVQPTDDSTVPVAPPRRKKVTQSYESSGETEVESAVYECGVQSQPPEEPTGHHGYHGEDLHPAYQSDGLETGYRPSLDLSTAIQGNCHVTALDDVAAKGLENSGLEVLDEDITCAESAHSEDSLDVPIEASKNEPVSSQQQCASQSQQSGLAASQSQQSGLVASQSQQSGLVASQSQQSGLIANQSQQSGHSGSQSHHGLSASQLRLSRTKSKTLAGGMRQTRPEKASSTKVLTDDEILEQVLVTNLDTGEELPLSLAEDKVPKSINPLALHIMRITKEYSSEKSKEGLDKATSEQGQTVKTIHVPKKRRKQLKKFLSKSVRKIKSELKSVKDDMFHGENSSSDDDEFVDGRRMIKIKASHSHKGPYDFDLLVPVQNLAEDSNAAIWTMKFSHCGKLLVTGGQDNLLRVWVLKSWYSYFDDMRLKYSEAANVTCPQSDKPGEGTEDEGNHAPFMPSPFCVYRGHTADMLDVSWSKNYFILSSSMDKTVRLWHVSRKECLCCFQHIDFVTAIAFHPKDDRYFLSGSLDGKLRLWSIPEKKVALWNEVSGQSKLITAANFCSDGKIAVGTYDGRCVLYTADHLDYHTQIHVRSTRGKNAKGGKITGVEPFPSENKILVTSNDSRIRLYDLRDKTLTCKYKGTINSSSRIKAVLNHDGRYIISGSEDGCIYIWKTQHDFYKFYSVRRDRNDFWEGVKAHTSVVTAAIFAPCPGLIIRPQFEFMDADDKENSSGVRGEVIISADITGAIKVFINKFKPGSG